MATNDTTTTATEAALITAFEARARADGFIDDAGFFIGPDDIDSDLTGIEWPIAHAET